MSLVETAVVKRLFEVDVFVDVNHAPPIRLPGPDRVEFHVDRLQVSYRRKETAERWRAWSWWLWGAYFRGGQRDSPMGPVSLSREELLRWDDPGEVPEWIPQAVERHRRELT
ncbi:hypothetical protein [Nonomuraea jabiensis]|uniref:hypothetical protein n=1 Tax=Nonomuraea jabiensis TaxID=882448 RepID=UPI003D73CFDE